MSNGAYAAAGFTYQHAYSVLRILDFLTDQNLDRVALDGRAHIEDLVLFDRSGAVTEVVQVKTRKHYLLWKPSEIYDILGRFYHRYVEGPPDADTIYRFVSDQGCHETIHTLCEIIDNTLIPGRTPTRPETTRLQHICNGAHIPSVDQAIEFLKKVRISPRFGNLDDLVFRAERKICDEFGATLAIGSTAFRHLFFSTQIRSGRGRTVSRDQFFEFLDQAFSVRLADAVRKSFPGESRDRQVKLVTEYCEHLRRRPEFQKPSQYCMKIPCRAGEEKRHPDALAFLVKWAKRHGGRHLLLLGDTGTGKSLLLRELMRDLISGPLACIPVYLPLNDVRPTLDLVDYAVASFRRLDLPADPADIRSLIHGGQCLFLLDGFDEISLNSDRQTVVKNVEAIKALCQNTAAGMILSCRTHHFRDRLEETLLGFERLYLVAPTKAEIRTYLDRECPRFAKQQAPVLLKKDLAYQPYMLNLIVSTLTDGADLSRLTRVELYRKYTDTWLADEEFHSIIPIDKKRDLMRILAAAMVRAGRPFLHHSELPDHIRDHFAAHDTHQLPFYTTDLRTRSFLNRDGNGYYRFMHASIMEYFAAHYDFLQLTDGKPVSPNMDIGLLEFLLAHVDAEAGARDHRDDEFPVLDIWPDAPMDKRYLWDIDTGDLIWDTAGRLMPRRAVAGTVFGGGFATGWQRALVTRPRLIVIQIPAEYHGRPILIDVMRNIEIIRRANVLAGVKVIVASDLRPATLAAINQQLGQNGETIRVGNNEVGTTDVTRQILIKELAAEKFDVKAEHRSLGHDVSDAGFVKNKPRRFRARIRNGVLSF